MNAVTNKPRAKAKPKAPERSALELRLAAIHNDLRCGQEKLRMALTAIDAAQPGEAAQVLLHHVVHDMLPPALAPMWRQPLSRADTDTALYATFPALAALEGVVALSVGQVAEATLREAFQLIDGAHNLIDFGDMPGALLECVDRTEADFLKGRDLAVSMLADADEVQANNPDSAYATRAYRDGKEQHRFARQYLDQLLADPELLDGFSAVLSAKLADQCSSPARHYAVALAEYQAGTIGADGTMPLEDDSPAEASSRDSPVTLQASGADAPTLAKQDEWGDFDPYCLLLQARDVAETAANDDGSDAIWGLHSLIEKSVEKVNKVVEGTNAGSEDVCNRASDELAGVLGVLHAVNTDGLDNPLLYAVESLLRMAKQQIDAKIERLIQVRLERSAA